MPSISFIIPGLPKGKGRPKFARMGNFVKTYTPKDTVNYENLVKMMFLDSASKTGWTKPDREEPLACRITCLFPKPQSWSKKKALSAIKHTKKPDCDNIGKVILDALNAIAFEDDSQVSMLHVEKVYSDACVETRVTLATIETPV